MKNLTPEQKKKDPAYFFAWYANLPLGERHILPAGIDSLEVHDNLSPWEIYSALNDAGYKIELEKKNIDRLLKIAHLHYKIPLK